MKNKILFIVLMLFFKFIYAQQNEIIQIGSEGHDGIYDLVVDENENKYITGFFQGIVNELKVNGDTDAFVAKINKENKLVWFKQIGSDYKTKKEITEFGKHIVIDNNNNSYVLGLYYNTIINKNSSKNNKTLSNGKQDVFLAKYNENGEEIWITTFGSYNNESIQNLFIDSSNNLYVVAKLEVDKERKRSSQVYIKINKEGELLWQKEITFNELIDFKVIHSEYKEDKLFLLLRSKKENYLVSYDNNGNLINKKNLEIENNIISFSINKNNELYFLITENSDADNSFKIIKANVNGDTVWSQDYYEQMSFKPKAINITGDLDEIIVTGDSRQELNTSSKYSYNSLIYKFDKDGNKISNHIFVGNHQNKIIKYLIEGESLYIVSQFYNEIELNNETKIISKGKTDSFIERIRLEKGVNPNESNNSISIIYPNPNKGKFYIKNINEIEKVKIFDLNGKLVFEKKISTETSLDVKNLKSAIYNVVLFKKGGEVITSKLLIDY